MNKYLVRNFKWRENLGKVPAKVYRLDFSSSSKVKIRISNFFEKKIKFLGFHGVVLVKTFPLMYQLLM